MSYLGLARKWRPQTFADLVGQQHIALTISNAIRLKRVSHGYLFTGTRGVGKTSSARIFAKTLRCPNVVVTETTVTSCNQCKDCTDISEGRSVDVLEIDGASNNGVDAVRELREGAKYLPLSGQYKIYIIDEVHMLTTAAFNALLKTLEEPPAHVIFVFATTDPQKIPMTVLSRCQRFDFKRVPEKDLKARLALIAQAEKIGITDEALSTLAREADGSMRDGVSLLDQALSICQTEEIDNQKLTQALGLVDKQVVMQCVSGILKREPLQALEAAQTIYSFGFDLKQFGKEILRQFRLILIAQVLKDHNLERASHFDISDTELKDIESLLGSRPAADLDYLFNALTHGLEQISRSSVPKLVLDVLLLKLASAETLVRVSNFKPTVSANSAAPEAYSAAASQAPAANTAKPQPVAPVTAKPITSSASVAAPAPAPAQKKTPPASIDLNAWKSAIELLRSKKPLFASMLEHVGFESAALDKTLLTIHLTYTKENFFYKDQLGMPAYKDTIAQLLQEHFGAPVRLLFKEIAVETKNNPNSANKSIVAMEEDVKRKILDEKKRMVLESDALKGAQQLLGAKIERLEVYK